MKLQELEITKTFNQQFSPYLADLRKILISYGWHYLGSGVEGIVAEHPNKTYVIKIFYSKSKYVDFIDFVKEHQFNPYLPRFGRYVRTIPGSKNKFSYVRMEKLTPIRDNEYKKFIVDLIYLFLCGRQNYLVSLTGIPLELVDDQLKTSGLDWFNLGEPGTDLSPIWEKLNKKPSNTLMKLVDDLIKLAKQNGYTLFDLHENNFMQRNGQLVIVDPFY
jgi:hypothetical protein